METGKTNRGFDIAKFTDHYGHECSLQKSSAVRPCIWLGINDAKPQVCVEGQGWTKVPFPEDTLFHTRMHLTREHVQELLPYLQKFAETGELT